MRKKLSYCVSISVTALLVAICLSTIASSGTTNCISCHSGSQPNAGFTFAAPVFSFSAPQSVNPNSTFNVVLSIIAPSRFEMIDPIAKVAVSGQGELSTQEQMRKSLTVAGGTFSAEWKIKAKDSDGTMLLDLQLNFTAHHSHAEPQGYNDYLYSTNSSYRISVNRTEIQLSKSQIVFVAGLRRADTFDIIAVTQVRNMNITCSSNLNGLIVLNSSGNIGNIEIGGNVSVSVLFNGSQSVVDNGRVNLVWSDESGVVDSTFISVMISENPEASSDGESLLKWVGRISGLLSFGLLFSSMGLGALKIGKERRIRIHCAISWLLLGLSLYHAVLLLVGPYSSVLLGKYVTLGYASALTIGLSSINGLLEKWITGVANHRTWIWMHRGFLTVAIILAITHGILIGTDFAILRSFLGG